MEVLEIEAGVSLPPRDGGMSPTAGGRGSRDWLKAAGGTRGGTGQARALRTKGAGRARRPSNASSRLLEPGRGGQDASGPRGKLRFKAVGRTLVASLGCQRADRVGSD